MDAYDTPRAVERYRRAFEKLTVGGSLSASGEVQCEKLRAKLKISEELHARLLSELETPEEEVTLELALAWRGQDVIECAVIHRGDFSLERVEVIALSTRFGSLQRFDWSDLDPGDRRRFDLRLLPDVSGGDAEVSDTEMGNVGLSAPDDLTRALASVGVQLQIRALDITEELITYRSPLISLVGEDAQLVDLTGDRATPLTQLSEPRALQSLLGSSDWRALPISAVSEDEFFQWEVQVTRAQAWEERERAEEWRVGDQSVLSLEASRVGVAELRERLCPGGVSWIGAPLGVGRDWETPAHQVRITQRLWCAETPTTRGLWSVIMGEELPEEAEQRRPAASVSWLDAVRFCNRLSVRLGLTRAYELDDDGAVRRVPRADGFRLPTEAEWEHLARAGLDRAYAGSNLRESVCWSIEDGEIETRDVGGRRPNAWGLFDCCGNVWEWCEDRFIEGAYRGRVGVTSDPKAWDLPAEVKRGETAHPEPDSTDAHDTRAEISMRVRRGGSVVTPEESCRVFTRVDGAPTWRSEMVGFRVVRSGEGRVNPRDRGARDLAVNWDVLSAARVYLGGEISSPRRAWALRLGALGIELVSREDEASAVVIIPPDIKKMKRGALARLEGLRRRARGLGTPVLELTELEALLEERERALYDRPDPRITWPDLYGKRVALLGRFRSTQRELMRRLRSRGVLTTPQLASADVLILGGGKRTAKQREALEGLDPDLIKINEVECLALLDAPEPFSLPS